MTNRRIAALRFIDMVPLSSLKIRRQVVVAFVGQGQITREVDLHAMAFADGDGRQQVEKPIRICSADCAVLCPNPWRKRSVPDCVKRPPVLASATAPRA